MTDFAERVAARAPRKPKYEPPTPPPPPKKTLEKMIDEAVNDTVEQVMGEIKILDVLGPPTLGSDQDAFDWGRSNFYFYLEYPTTAVTTGVLKIRIPDIETLFRSWARESERNDEEEDAAGKASSEDIVSAYRSNSILDAIKRVLSNTDRYADSLSLAKDEFELPNDFLERLTDKADAAVTQRSSAIDEYGDSLELTEYPAVYFEWSIQVGGVDYGNVQKSGGTYNVPVKVTWKIKPKACAMSEDAERNRWTHLTLASMATKVAARYKNKKVVDSEKGGKTTIYEYSERQVQNRNREKAERVEKLRKSIGKVRSRVKKDLTSSDPEKMLTALAVALMDTTFERVGNETSAKENEHFGVTGWQRKHVSLGKGKATIRYTGKSGVKQEKVVSDASILKALRNAYAASDEDDAGLLSWEGGKVTAEKVNSYLEQFDITAKDIRGYHANAEVQKRLKAIRSKGGALPEDKKEAKAKLKEEFKQALDEAAEAVGHESSTLRSMYLVPGMEAQFLKDGTVIEKLKSASESSLPVRVVSRYLGESDPLGE